MSREVQPIEPSAIMIEPNAIIQQDSESERGKSPATAGSTEPGEANPTSVSENAAYE